MKDTVAREVRDLLYRIAGSYYEIDLSTALPSGAKVEGHAVGRTASHEECCRIAMECINLINVELMSRKK